MKKLKTILFLLLSLLLVTHCTSHKSDYRDWNTIVHDDTLKIGTMTSPTDFYIIRGQNFGLEYQKISDFADEHNLYLDIKIANNVDSLLIWLNSGEIDLCISPLPLTRNNQASYLFAGLTDTSSIVMVQRKSPNMVEYIADLADKSIYVESNSAGEIRLQQIQNEIGHGINVISNDTLMNEDLLIMMSTVDSIEFVVSDKRSLNVISQYYDNLDGSLQLSAPIKYGWVVHQKNITLKQALDSYFCTPEREKYYKELLGKDNHLQRFFKMEGIKLSTRLMDNGDISPYDEIFRKEASRLGWHWTYLAAIAFHESTFRSKVVAWSGARGLMGIMPATGAAFGASTQQLLDPEISVKVAVDCLIEYGQYYKNLPDMHEQIYFTLASYNAGNGHILDAIRLAQKYNAPTDRWYDGVREYVLLKSNPTYYNDPVVRFGYLRGRETVNYVDNITRRQEYYQSIAKVK